MINTKSEYVLTTLVTQTTQIFYIVSFLLKLKPRFAYLGLFYNNLLMGCAYKHKRVSFVWLSITLRPIFLQKFDIRVILLLLFCHFSLPSYNKLKNNFYGRTTINFFEENWKLSFLTMIACFSFPYFSMSKS